MNPALKPDIVKRALIIRRAADHPEMVIPASDIAEAIGIGLVDVATYLRVRGITQLGLGCLAGDLVVDGMFRGPLPYEKGRDGAD